jgi:hypothetical protein
MKKNYRSPTIVSEESFETSALACGKTPQVPPGSHHFYSAYDTFTGHLGPQMAPNESAIGSAGVGFGPGGTSQVYGYTGLCVNWVSLNT